jgi:hypothetical protein
VLLVAAVVVLDPYDTGRYALLAKRGVPPQGPRTAHASRGRDPAFDAVIIGNSRMQLLSPEKLSALTGLSWVSLTVPATGPKEQLVLLDYFLRHHDRPKAVALGIEGAWCAADAEWENTKPFPFWLYDQSARGYLSGFIRYGALERILPRLRYALGLGSPGRARPDGYWDYSPWYEERTPEAILTNLAAPSSGTAFNETGRFPSLDKLARVLEGLPAETAVVLVRPPIYTTGHVPPGHPMARSDRDCRAAMQRAAQAHARSAVVDWDADRPENRDPANYFDHTHYRAPIARAIEQDVANALKGLATP